MDTSNLGDLMKQAKQLQSKMQQTQEDLKKLRVTGESGAGAVKVTLTGLKECTDVSIDPNLLKEELSILEDLIAAAINDAVRKVDTTCKTRLSSIASGIDLGDLPEE